MAGQEGAVLERVAKDKPEAGDAEAPLGKKTRGEIRDKIKATFARLRGNRAPEDFQDDASHQENGTNRRGLKEKLFGRRNRTQQSTSEPLYVPDEWTNPGADVMASDREAEQADELDTPVKEDTTSYKELYEELSRIEGTTERRTRITDILDKDAEDHPKAWSERAEPLFGQVGHIALGYKDIGVTFANEIQESDGFVYNGPPVDGSVVYADRTSTKSWIVNVYGSRWVEDPDGKSALATTNLIRLPGLHEAIVRDILVDEHSRPSKLVTEGAQKFGDFNEEGLKLWLTTVHKGFSPIIATGELDPDGNPIYMTHDYTDYHTASNLLWGRATQDRVTKAAGYELKRRETGQPPLGERQHDGVSVIDTLTCSEHQIDILDYAMHGPGNSPKERMLAAWQALETMDLLNGGEIPDELTRKWSKGQHLDPEVAGYNMFILNNATGDMEDFIQRYESNGERKATKKEKMAALQDALVDITRVAEKLLGIHDGTDLELPQSQREELLVGV